jgi:DNA-binding MarR family transcriptional regulator
MVEATSGSRIPHVVTYPTSTFVPDLFRIARRLRRAGGPEQTDVAAVLILHRLTSDGPRRPSDLAVDVGLDLSTVSRHVKALEDTGLTERRPDPHDGRSFRVSITARGSGLLADALRRRQEVVDRALSLWDADDADALRRLLGRLADDLDRLDEEQA